MGDLDKVSVDRNHGTGYDADYYKSDTELKAEIDRLRSEFATAEGEADRLRSAYDDVRALNIKLTMTCTAELAAKDDRIAQLEAWRAACQEVRCYRVVEAETEALRKQLQDERNDHDHTIARLTERLEASHGALKDALKLGDDAIEALRKQLAEFGAGEDTTTMTRKSFAEVLQALADVRAGSEAKDARMAELEAQRQRADFERHRYVDRGEPRVMPKDGFINDYD